MQQGMGLGVLSLTLAGGDQCMHHTRFSIDANVRLHAEVPLIAFWFDAFQDHAHRFDFWSKTAQQ